MCMWIYRIHTHGCDILTSGIGGEKRYITPFIHPFNPYPTTQIRSLFLFYSIYICLSCAFIVCKSVFFFVPFLIVYSIVWFAAFTVLFYSLSPNAQNDIE